MEKIGLVIDSTVYLDQPTIDKHNLKVVPLNVIEDEDTSYRETDITPQFVLDQVDAGKKLTTAQPSPQLFTEAYDSLFSQGYEKVLVIPLSRGISGTYQSAVIGKETSNHSANIHVFDTLNAGFGNELLVLEILRLIDEGHTHAEIVEKTNTMIADAGLLFTVQNLFSLQKGGRLSRGQALLGTVLRVRPIIRVNEAGELKMIHKERTHAKMINYMVNQIKQHVGEEGSPIVRIVHQKSQDSADALQAALKKAFSSVKITTTDRISPVFSIHIGKKGLGVTWFQPAK